MMSGCDRQGRPALRRWLAMVVMGAAVTAVAQDEFRQHGVHQHGLVSATVALDGSALRVEIDSPADSMVGFEHAPRNEAERAMVADVAAWLHAGRALVYVPAAADCRLSGVQVHEPQWGGDHRDHDHDHDHDLTVGDGGHQDYRVVLDYRCQQPAALQWLQFKMLEKLRNVHQVRVQVLTSSRQTSQTLTDPLARVALQ